MKKRYSNIKYTKEDFEALKTGDKESLGFVYKTFYEYVTGILRFKYKANINECNDVYGDAILKFQAAAINETVIYGNIKAYLTKVSVNVFRQNQRDRISRVKKYELFLSDPMHERNSYVNDEFEFDEERKKLIEAVKWGMAQLGEVCRNILTDTIIKGLKPGKIFKNYNYKNARVLTDRKAKCKKHLLELVIKRIKE